MSHVQHGHPAPVHQRPCPGAAQRQTQPQTGTRQKHAASLFLLNQEYRQQHIAECQPENNVFTAGIYRRQRRPGQELRSEKHIADRPRQHPAQRAGQLCRYQTHGADRDQSVENQADRPQRQQIGHHTDEADRAKIHGGQRHRQHHSAEGHRRAPAAPAPEPSIPFGPESLKPAVDRFAEQQNPCNGAHGKLEPRVYNHQGIGRQHHKTGKGQGGKGIIFPVKHLREHHQPHHDAGPGNRRGEARHSREKCQRRKPDQRRQEPSFPGEHLHQLVEDGNMEPGNRDDVPNPADFQIHIHTPAQTRAVTQQEGPHEGLHILREGRFQYLRGLFCQNRPILPPRPGFRSMHLQIALLIGRQEDSLSLIAAGALPFPGSGVTEPERPGDSVSRRQLRFLLQIDPHPVWLSVDSHIGFHRPAVVRFIAVVRRRQLRLPGNTVPLHGVRKVQFPEQGEPPQPHAAAQHPYSSSPNPAEPDTGQQQRKGHSSQYPGSGGKNPLGQ